MNFSAPFSRSSNSIDEEIVIDAEVAGGDEPNATPGNAAIPRNAAVPEAADVRPVAKKSDRELAVRSVAVATAGGVVAGAATIAVAAVAKNMAKPTPGLSRRRKKDILQSQSFLIDVHLLKGNGNR
ncbi:MAG: hypothetical protein ACPGWS_10205 [Solirubrobacterales bacterium]